MAAEAKWRVSKVLMPVFEPISKAKIKSAGISTRHFVTLTETSLPMGINVNLLRFRILLRKAPLLGLVLVFLFLN
jgi:hypothetical protein